MSAVRQPETNAISAGSKRSKRPTLWQPKQPVFWLFVVLLVPSALLIVLQVVLGAQSAAAVGAAILLALVQITLFVLVVRAMPRFRRQSRSLRVAALLWGLVIAPVVAINANTGTGDLYGSLGLNSLEASLSAPVNEDLVRLLGVLLVLSLAQTKPLTVMDGAIYGFIVGAGFEIIENLLYALRGDDFAATISVGITRLSVGFGLHALWTTVAGAALAYCLMRRQQGLPGRWWVLVPAIALPMLLHAGWDAPNFSIIEAFKLVSFFVLYALSVGAFLWAVRWGRRSEFAWYTEHGGSPKTLREFTRLPRSERRHLATAAVAGASPQGTEGDVT
ncbi:MAG: PrsW family intramembrane metalloprotease [Microbacteriaceae bacterium]|nr:PrsW family intramembrane metalloprotease [Microbacteriaceae bacterium]